MADTPRTQYATAGNLAARQRLWLYQRGGVDLIAWVLELAGVGRSDMVLDLGCGNGRYLDAMRDRGVDPVGCDLSLGMLQSAGSHRLVNADAGRLPFADGRFGVVLAAHMLYHVADPTVAAGELRRVLAPGGMCIAVTNGAGHLASIREAVESTVALSDPGWRMVDPATQSFSLESGGVYLAAAFDSVVIARPADPGRVVIDDAEVIADYLRSVTDVYGPQVSRPWPEIVDAVRQQVHRTIQDEGAFVTAGDVGAFMCR